MYELFNYEIIFLLLGYVMILLLSPIIHIMCVCAYNYIQVTMHIYPNLVIDKHFSVCTGEQSI